MACQKGSDAAQSNRR